MIFNKIVTYRRHEPDIALSRRTTLSTLERAEVLVSGLRERATSWLQELSYLPRGCPRQPHRQSGRNFPTMWNLLPVRKHGCRSAQAPSALCRPSRSFGPWLPRMPDDFLHHSGDKLQQKVVLSISC